MPPASSNSFIPKRNTTNKPLQGVRRNFFVMSMVSYALFVAAPLASIAIFIYDRHTVIQFNQAVKSLDDAISTFNEPDYLRVTQFDDQLNLANKLLASHVSVFSLLKILESATAETVQFKDIAITRTNLDTLTVEANMRTGSFDGVLFQRAEYNTNESIKTSELSEVALVTDVAEGESDSAVRDVEFKASFTFAATDVLYLPLTTIAAPTEVLPEPVDITDTETPSTSTSVVNEPTL